MWKIQNNADEVDGVAALLIQALFQYSVAIQCWCRVVMSRAREMTYTPNTCTQQHVKVMRLTPYIPVPERSASDIQLRSPIQLDINVETYCDWKLVARHTGGSDKHSRSFVVPLQRARQENVSVCADLC